MKSSSWAPALNVSVVVPAYNEADNIQAMLDSVLRQEVHQARILEVVVVASGCTDDTADRARKLCQGRPGVHVHVQERRAGKVAAINSYLRMRDPRAHVIVLSAADVLLAPDVVEKLVAVLRNNPDIGMVGARPVPDNDQDEVVGRMVRLLWELHHRVALDEPKLGEVVAFRADLVESVSELSVVDEASIENIIREKGYQLGYAPDAIVRNHGPESIHEYFDQRRRIARGHYWLDFAFGYRVATMQQSRVTQVVRGLFREEGAAGKVALGCAMAVEVAARAAGFFDARVVGGRHRTWTRLESTKKGFGESAPRSGAHVHDLQAARVARDAGGANGPQAPSGNGTSRRPS